MTDSTQPRGQITRTRERLACTACRRRKLKCDRLQPCAACARRGDHDACAYQRFSGGWEHERERRMQAEARLEHLERMVQDLAGGKDVGGGPDSAWSAVTEGAANGHSVVSNGSVSVGGPGNGDFSQLQNVDNQPGKPLGGQSAGVYAGETHWSAMLDDINELRLMLPKNDFNDSPSDVLSDDTGISIIFGGRPALSYQSILSGFVPPRQEANRLIAAYFRSQSVSAPFIHSSAFQRQYQAFWEDQAGTSPLWVSVLLSISHISAKVLRTSTGPDTYQGSYSVGAAYCLAMGEYFRPKKFAVESILLFTQAQCLGGLNLPPDAGMLISQAVRVATLMGYHRDPAPGKFSPFEGEMRRRAWSLVMQLDLLIAFHLGTPSNIQYPTWDSKTPCSLIDADFDEDTKVLPPPRPSDFPTEIQFYNIKHDFMKIFEKVLRNTLSTEQDASDLSLVTELDTELRSTWDRVPSLYHPRPISDSVVDSGHVIVTRLCVSSLYYKCLCVLHRRYAIQGRQESVQALYFAATNLVGGLLDAFDEFRPGGQAEAERWFMSSLTWHDFLLGSTALCLVLAVARGDAAAEIGIDVQGIVDKLRRSRVVCLEQLSSRTRETLRVATLLGVVIEKMSPATPQSETLSGGSVSVSQAGQTVMDPMFWDAGSAGVVDDGSWDCLEQSFGL